MDFSEVEEEISKYAPTVIYKYRTWTNDFHKRLLTHQEAWFAHPFTLNDPHDIRRPYLLNVDGYNTAAMLQKLWENGRRANPHLDYFELAPQVAERWEQIQANPKAYFQKNIEELYNDEEFHNRYGVFSTGSNGLSIRMWNSKDYSDCNKGYCIGFNTVKLAKGIQCFIGKVTYTDDEIEYKILDDLSDEQTAEEVLMKYPKWSHEEEFRFLTFNVQNEERTRKFPIQAVAEVIIGYNASPATEKEIIEQTRKIYGSEVPIYKAVLDAKGLGLERRMLDV